MRRADELTYVDHTGTEKPLWVPGLADDELPGLDWLQHIVPALLRVYDRVMKLGKRTEERVDVLERKEREHDGRLLRIEEALGLAEQDREAVAVCRRLHQREERRYGN